MSAKQPEVAVVMGSDSDWPAVQEAVKTLDQFGIASEVRVLSAHRTPALAARFASEAQARGLQVIIAAAGGAAHLAGVLAAHTVLPVIGIPIKGGAVNGVDALLATVQMPAGVPVATVTLGSAGPVNAALLAVQMLALSRPELSRKLVAHKRSLEQKVAEADARLQAEREKAGERP
jgi:5-(carboxyamino)imidazole ribonucleotide mutase